MCDEQHLGYAVSTMTAQFNYDCELNLFQWGINYDFDQDQAIEDRIQLVDDVMYFEDT